MGSNEVNLIEKYRAQLATTLDAAGLRLSNLERELDEVQTKEKQAEVEQALLRSKLMETNGGASRAMQDGYRKLLISCCERMLRLKAEVGRLRPLVATAKSAYLEAEANLQIASLAVESQSKALEIASSRLDQSAAQVAELLRYPNAYPNFAGAGSFFIESLLHPSGPISPFQGVTAPEKLDSDNFAVRFHAYFEDDLCTIRIVHPAPLEGQDLAEAWQIESENISSLNRILAGAPFTSVLRAAVSTAPGFVIFRRPSGKTLIEIANNHARFPLSQILDLAASFANGLEFRARNRLISVIPRPDTISINGGSLSFLEPTSIAVGEMTPPELRGILPAELRRITRKEYESCWVYGCAAFVSWLLPGESRRLAMSLSSTSAPRADTFIGPIQSAARSSNNAFTASLCAKFAEILTLALQSEPRNRPSLTEFQTLFRR